MKTNGWTFACVITICLTAGTMLEMSINAGVWR